MNRIHSQDLYGLFHDKKTKRKISKSFLQPNKRQQLSSKNQQQQKDHQQEQEESSSVDIHNYHKIKDLGKGSFGDVYQAIDKKTNELVAIKKIKQTNEDATYGLSTLILREINVFIETKSHVNIVSLQKFFFTKSFSGKIDCIYLVMDFVPMNLREYIEQTTEFIHPDNVKKIMKQLIGAVNFFHSNLILHRDLKPDNILIDPISNDIKLTDFGLSRRFHPALIDRQYTNEVVTIWYRCPELLIGETSYGSEIDVWSIGCIMTELITRNPLFPTDDENQEQQLSIIKNVLRIPHCCLQCQHSNLDRITYYRLEPYGIYLLSRLLAFNPKHRISCYQALHTSYLYDDKSFN